MQYLNRFVLLTLNFITVTFSVVANSSEVLQVLDKNLNPVKDAVVSIPSSAAVVDPLPVAVMDQVNRQFSPKVLVIKKGQKVTFPNSDEIRHHVYSFSTIKQFEIRLYKGVSDSPIQFDKSGIGVLGCNIHDNMVGYIYVAENEVAKVSDEQGKVTFDSPLPATVTLWHSDLTSSSSERQRFSVKQKNGNYQVVLDIVIGSEELQKRTFGSRTFGNRDQ